RLTRAVLHSDDSLEPWSPGVSDLRRDRRSVPEVRPSDVLEILDLLSVADIEAWVDGGWAVDALIGYETRPHADLDIAVLTIDLVHTAETLTRHGLAVVRNHGPHNVVFGDAAGRLVDVHAFDHTSCVRGEDGIARHAGDGLAY